MPLQTVIVNTVYTGNVKKIIISGKLFFKLGCTRKDKSGGTKVAFVMLQKKVCTVDH